MDFPIPISYRFGFICWAYYVCHTCRRKTVTLLGCTFVFGLYLVPSRNRTSLRYYICTLSCTSFQQFALLVHQIQLPEDTAPPPIHSTPPTTTATQASANTTTTPASVTRAMPSAVGTMPTTIANPPSPATAPATTNRQQQSFFSFFIHHIRTDPQAKLCKYAAFFPEAEAHERVRGHVVHFLICHSSGHFVSSTLNDIHLLDPFNNLVTSNHPIGATWKEQRFYKRIHNRGHSLSVGPCIV